MKNQFMPMFWGDFFANTLHLTAQELGAYTALIGHAWEHDGKIAVADLQRVARVSNFNWQKVRPRLMQFFNTLSDANNWIHEVVRSKLAMAAEISNKRKAAALQKHSKSHANDHANSPHTILNYKIENLSNGKGREAPVPANASPATAPRQGMSPDRGNDYRAPPRSKSDNILRPLPEKSVPGFKRP